MTISLSPLRNLPPWEGSSHKQGMKSDWQCSPQALSCYRKRWQCWNIWNRRLIDSIFAPNSTSQQALSQSWAPSAETVYFGSRMKNECRMIAVNVRGKRNEKGPVDRIPRAHPLILTLMKVIQFHGRRDGWHAVDKLLQHYKNEFMDRTLRLGPHLRGFLESQLVFRKNRWLDKVGNILVSFTE